MLNKFALPVVEFRRLPPLFCLSFGALLGLLTVAFVLNTRAEQKQADLLSDYGTAIAKMSALDVVEASISGDLVSMHAIMQQIVVHPRVLTAAVYGTEQQLMVQAGQQSLHGFKTRAFTADIPLRNRDTGSVTITINAGFPDEAAVKWALAGTSLLLLILALLALYDARGSAWYFRPSAPARDEPFHDADQALVEELMHEADRYFHAVSEPGDPAQDAEAGAPAVEAEQAAGADVDSDEQVAPTLTHANLILALTNRHRLEQQLSVDRFAQLQTQFDKAVDEVLALYGGARVGTNADASIVCASFTSSEGLAEAAFRAACSAFLVDALTGTRRLRFALVAEVREPDCDAKLAVAKTGIFLQASLADEFLAARVDTEIESDERLHVFGFKPAVEALLQHQQAQLLQ